MRERFIQFDSYREGSQIEQKRTQVHEALLTHVESSFDNPDFLVGKGSIARVLKLQASGQERKICAKFIDTSRTNGTVDYKIRFGQTPEYNDLGEEAEFLDMLRSVDPEVRVPEPYYFWQKKSTQNGFPRVKSFLVMELLDAVTIEDMVKGAEKPPEGFDAQAFFGKLRRFMETMHQKGVVHGDVHDRNIMVDRVTGNPRVIDFGTATKIGQTDNPTEDKRGSVFGSDTSGVAELERMVAQFLTESKKSV